MRLVIYDKTQGSLTWAWRVGAWLLKVLGRSDRVVGVESWDGFFAACRENKDQLKRIEYWGHGHKGGVSCNGVRMDDAEQLNQLARFMATDALLWWRTCSSFSTERGHAFAIACSDAIGCRVAGHTYIISIWQGGLHVLPAKWQPAWSVTEGVKKSGKNRWSWPWSAHSIFLLSKGPR